jgi:acyl-CoA synthetase (AMP-forming)/AMP-acid ligase II/thioesterase domain-containing protein
MLTAGDGGFGVSKAQPTFFDAIADHAARDQDRPAIISSGTDPLSLGELVTLIGGIWETLREAGVGNGSQVAIALPSGLESVISTVTIASYATCVPLNPNLTQGEIERELARSNLDALIVPAWHDSSARAASENGSYGVFEASKVSTSLSSFALRCARSVKAPRVPPAEISSQSTVLILRTSATTGPSKLVPVTHGNMLDLAGKMAGWFGLTTEDRAACVLPTYYAAGSKLNVLVPLLLGESIAIPVGVRPERLAEWIHELRPTWFSAGPTFLQAVLDGLQSRREQPQHALRFITSGSAHLPSRLRTDLEAMLGCPILGVYGISEAGVMAANPAPPATRKPGTVGRIAAGELVIRGKTGAAVPTSKIGEIFVSGPGLMPGYLGESKPVGAGLQDGWLRTGDIGSLDEDGFLTLHGREDDFINRGGEKISPIEIDDALMQHPAVAEAAAFAVPHPRLGEDVAAAVVFRAGLTVKPTDLRGFLQKQLAAFKVPRRIVIRDQLPKGHTGKVERRRLAQDLRERAGPETQIAVSQSTDDLPVDDKLVVQITEIWEQLLKISPLSLDDDFFENGGDSLLAMDMIIELELMIGRPVPRSILFDASTIGQLAQKLSEPESERPTSLIRLHPNGGQAPVFYFHGDINGRGFAAVTLARLLGPNQPFYVVDAHGMGQEPIPSTIEAMAADRLPLILDAQPKGPYRLFGNCLGGLVAFEVARMLIAAGKQIEIVVLLDSPTLNARRSMQLLLSMMSRARPLGGPIVEHVMARTWFRCVRLQKFLSISWARRLKALKIRILNLTAGVTSQVHSVVSPVNRNAQTSSLRRFTDERSSRYAAAMSNYLPKPLAVRVICFSIDFDARPWRRISSNLEIIKTPGDHYLPDFAYIAKYLRGLL